MGNGCFRNIFICYWFLSFLHTRKQYWNLTRRLFVLLIYIEPQTLYGVITNMTNFDVPAVYVSDFKSHHSTWVLAEDDEARYQLTLWPGSI